MDGDKLIMKITVQLTAHLTIQDFGPLLWRMKENQISWQFRLFMPHISMSFVAHSTHEFSLNITHACLKKIEELTVQEVLQGNGSPLAK
jgi:hypothetical protein